MPHAHITVEYLQNDFRVDYFHEELRLSLGSNATLTVLLEVSYPAKIAL